MPTSDRARRGQISFEAGSNWYDAPERLHRFRGQLDGASVTCVISQIALEALGGERRRIERPCELFDAIEHRVFELATRKFKSSGRNAHGFVAINSVDLGLLDYFSGIADRSLDVL